MYKIEKTEYGLKTVVEGFNQVDEVTQWASESKRIIGQIKKPFSLLADMRQMKTLPPDARQVVVEGQKYYRDNGLERSVCVLSDKIVAMQFKRVAKETGVDAYERYIDASSDPDWEQTAEKWLKHGIEID